MDKHVRYGILSTAQIAVNRHIPAAREAVNSRVVAIGSRDLAKAEACAEKTGIPTAYGSYQEVLDDAGVDAVINPLPNGLHCEWTVKAAEAGKHILCEKPLAVSVEEARRMIDAAKANKVLLTEAFTHRLNPQMQFARMAVEAGDIGPVKLARAELTFAIQDWQGDVRAQRDLAGGALMDAGCYCVSALRFVLEAEPLEARAFQRLHGKNGVDSTFAGLLRFPEDCLGVVTTGMEQSFSCVLEVVGLQGRIEVPNMFDENSQVRMVVGGQERIETFAGENRFQVQLERFSRCILEGRQPEFLPEDGLRNTAALVALGKAAASGGTVRV